jgi:alpha-glucosidase
MLALPGSAYLYQGEELGLPEVDDLPDDALRDPVWTSSGHTVRGRDGCRVPLPWQGTQPPFGFGPDGSEPWLPQPADWSTYTVEYEQTRPESMLSLYRAALRVRRSHAALGDGTLTWAPSPDDVLILRREPDLLCVVNLSAAPFPLPQYHEILLASEPFQDGKLPTDTAVWLRI